VPWSEELRQRLAALHRELGIPADYAIARGLAAHAEADETTLVAIGTNSDGRTVAVIPPAAAAWQRLRAAAAADGIELRAESGFRSVARQAEIIRDKLASGQTRPEILRYVAAPGFSEHHTGRAIDIASPEHIDLDEEFERTAAFKWLATRALSFGFHLSYPRGNTTGIGYEPWHWCWHPVAATAPNAANLRSAPASN
jgi:D-alanyl-D-alanine carboxypeptidase